MIKIMIKVIKKIPFYYPIRKWVARKIRNYTAEKKQIKELVEWENNGRPSPPPHIIKQKVLREYATKYGLKTLVETGTCYGDMVEAMKSDFDRIYSIELSKELYEETRIRFKRASNVELIHGDSSIELKKLMDKISQPTLFWLDGHFSGGVTARGEKDTPIYEELRHILDSCDRGHVIIIDDARCFGTDPAYPSLEELSMFIKSKRTDLEISVQGDSIRIVPKQYQV